MKKIIIGLVCLGFFIGIADISFADSWNARKNKVKKLLKKNNLVTSDRFELTYAQKITDRMSNHFVYVLEDTQTGMEYLIYTVGDGNSTIINNLAIAPMMPAGPGQIVPSVSKTMIPDDAADEEDDEDQETDAEDTEDAEDAEQTENKQ